MKPIEIEQKEHETDPSQQHVVFLSRAFQTTKEAVVACVWELTLMAWMWNNEGASLKCNFINHIGVDQ